MFCGYPALAALQPGALYPPHVGLAAALPLLAALSASYLLHAWLLARGTAALVRELGGTRRAALFAAGALLLSGSVACHGTHLSVIVALGWTPWVLSLAVRSARTRGWAPPLLLALAFGISLLQAGPQWVWFQALMAAALAATLGRPIAPALARVAVGLAVGAALAFPLLWPAREYLQVFARPAVDPLALGVRLADLPAWLLGDADPATLEVVLPGAAVWALALLRLARGGPWDPLARGGAALAAVGLFLCPGGANPLFRLLALLPPWSLFRVPARHALLLEVGLVLLAASGLERLLRGELDRGAPRRALVVLLGLSGAALAGRAIAGAPLLGGGLGWLALALLGLGLGGAAAGSHARRAWAAVLLAGLLLQLLGAQRALNPSSPREELEAPPPLAGPIAASANPRTLDLAAHHGIPAPEQARRLRRNSGARFGVAYFGGYDPLAPLVQEGLVLELEGLLAREPGRFVERCRELSIAWVVLDDDLAPPGLAGVARDAGARLWAVPGARPLAYLLPEDGGAPVAVSLSRPWPGAIRLETACERPARLVVASAWYPGWIAEIDGAPAEDPDLDPDSRLFMSVPLPAGAHRVELRFESDTIAVALRVGGAAWVAWAAALWLALRRRPA